MNKIYDVFIKELPEDLFEGYRESLNVSIGGLSNECYLGSSQIYSLERALNAIRNVVEDKKIKTIDTLLERCKNIKKGLGFSSVSQKIQFNIKSELLEIMSGDVDVFKNPRNTMCFFMDLRIFDFNKIESILVSDDTKNKKAVFAKFLYDAFKPLNTNYDVDTISFRDSGLNTVAVHSIAYLKSWSAHVVAQKDISAKDAIYDMYNIFFNHFTRIGSQKSLIDLSFKILEHKKGDKELYLKVSQDLKKIVEKSSRIENVKYLDEIIESHGLSENFSKSNTQLSIKKYSINISFDSIILLNDYKIKSKNVEDVKSILIDVFTQYITKKDILNEYKLDIDKFSMSIEGSISSENKEARFQTGNIENILLIEKIFDDFSELLPFLVNKINPDKKESKDLQELNNSLLEVRNAKKISKKIEESISRVDLVNDGLIKSENFKI